MSHDYDALIIGAGPAGMSAAARLGKAGASVLVIDENPRPGGQYYRVPAETDAHRAPFMAYLARGQKKLAAALSLPGVEFRAGTQLFDLTPGFRAGLNQIGGGASFVTAKTVLVATGAYENVVPFPGWTLPGVMTLGAAQNLFKTQGATPGRTIVMAGSGPFLWLVSDQLQRAGAGVVEVLEGSPLARSFGFGLRSWNAPLMALQGMGFWARLFTGKAKFQFGWHVIAAHGKERLERITVAPITGAGIDMSRARDIACDTLCLSHTLIPSTDIARLMSVATALDPVSGAAVPQSGPFLETSVPGLFVAGEANGIGGGPVAEAEGALAGIGMAQSLGRLATGTASAEADPPRRTAAARRSIVRDMFRTYAPPAVLTEAIADTTTVCRCEEVTAGEVRATCRAGDTHADIVKSRTRTGMGYCQGRMCGPTVQQLMADTLGTALPAPFKPRAPLKPLPVNELVKAEGIGG